MKFLVSFLLLVICLASVAKATEQEEKHSGAPKEKRGVLFPPVAFAPAVVRVPVAHTHIVRVPYYPPVVTHHFHPPPGIRVLKGVPATISMHDIMGTH
ncbi:hypothetical protein J437_LFUL005354 [Ladona fulva]|uniref:Uncharacterized protein n=1 Tax=Ladona fulva TaxID=123851 RepID=A0A8K0JZD7_LADFU|nr:hypothetical protein J437_LFUL005354 [Ladona fulva]